MEQRKSRFIGIDLAKKSMEVCILCDGKPAIRSSYKTDTSGRTRFCANLQATDTVAMEACALAFVLSRQVEQDVGCWIIVLNPGKLAMIWQSTRKTDKVDARKLASLVQRYPEDELPVVAVPDEREEMMHTFVSMKHYLVTIRTSLLNRLHALYVQAGITSANKCDLDSGAARERMATRLNGYLAQFAAVIGRELGVTEQETRCIISSRH